ncbi:hypothetical protein BV22DRAFT_1181261 [Leucogyrophana mollusca]|uniref:Uncharacterized protein n=1 Tax=Leucogyrophana mollusca TaxID=85980 RepID=A0ACB8B5L9_9AGAM|nr:hypothetical protein BV22DRAFT_1181261 [Leucogyrophana mollusca]
MLSNVLVVALLSTSLVNATIPNAMSGGRPTPPKIPAPKRNMTSPNGTALPPITEVYYFDQLIDHNNPDLGTFQQRYWMSWEFYEPGGPIILTTPGESNADGFEGYLTNVTINGMIAQQQSGAAVLIEHRFFGYSNPYDNLNEQSLELLTIQQAIDDLVFFAQTADLPMPGGDQVKPDQAPWILIGGSYAGAFLFPGALTSWTMLNKPGVFFAGYSSSGVVEAITDYYGYFTAIREYMPQNCSSDVQAVIAYLDRIDQQGDEDAIQGLKNSFGLGSLTRTDDFASALRQILFSWQDLQPNVGPGAKFFDFCDALEVKDGVSASATGWGLDYAIYAWGNFFQATYYSSLCGNEDAELCLGTSNASQAYYTDVSINNSDRSWMWFVCNQVGFYQVGPPQGQPAIVSRILRPVYDESRCVSMFPNKFSTPPTPSVGDTNTDYGGWGVQINRLFFANGLRDPWREATVSAEALNKAGTDTQPIYEGDGFHCSDLSTESGMLDESIGYVQMAALGYMRTWLAEWSG